MPGFIHGFRMDGFGMDSERIDTMIRNGFICGFMHGFTDEFRMDSYIEIIMDSHIDSERIQNGFTYGIISPDSWKDR